jgi:hypothetical protein
VVWPWVATFALATTLAKRPEAATAFSSRRAYAALAGWALLIVAAFVAVVLATQSGQHTPPPVVLADNMAQQVQPVNQSDPRADALDDWLVSTIARPASVALRP